MLYINDLFVSFAMFIIQASRNASDIIRLS